jgi:DNA-binding TFAR19-related protein (PDSD5 family)
MEVIQTVKLNRNEINTALEDYLAKQGYQANQISFKFSENHLNNTKTVTGAEIIVTKPSVAKVYTDG